MLDMSDERILNEYKESLATMPVEIKHSYITVPVVDLQWLIDKCEELNTECKESQLKIDQLEGKA